MLLPPLLCRVPLRCSLNLSPRPQSCSPPPGGASIGGGGGVCRRTRNTKAATSGPGSVNHWSARSVSVQHPLPIVFFGPQASACHMWMCLWVTWDPVEVGTDSAGGGRGLRVCISFFLSFFFFFFCYFRATSTAYVRGLNGAEAAGLCQSHSNVGSLTH